MASENSGRERIFKDIDLERRLQDDKWGEAVNRHLPLTVWITVLSEEIGEASQAVLQHKQGQLQKELTQIAAVAVAMLEAMWEAPWGVRDEDAG